MLSQSIIERNLKGKCSCALLSILSLYMYSVGAEKNKVNSKADAVVIGAGPTGLFSALTMARKDLDVVVCEEHKEVGLPNHCAGHISVKGLKQLGINLPPDVVENEIRGAVFCSPSGYELRLRVASPVTLVINRAFFDKHLARLAQEAGARILLGTKVETLQFSSKFITGVTLRNGGKLSSRIVIDTEGVASTFLKQADLQQFDRRHVVSAVQGEVEHVDDVENDLVEVYPGQHFAPGLFAWIIPRRNGSAKIGLATKTGNPREFFKHFLHAHPNVKKKLSFRKVKNISYHLIPLGGPISRTYSNGFLVAGDAASQVKPTTGGGVIMGLTCAKIAGETACEAMRLGNFTESFLAQYQSAWKNEIGFDMMVMKRIRLMLNSLSDHRLDGIIRLCSQLQVSESFQKVRDIDFQGRALLPIFRSPRAWAVFFYFFLASIM